jgi:hypothetical protein
MLQFSAGSFFWCGAAMRSITADCITGAATVIHGEVAIAMGQFLDDKAREKALDLFRQAEPQFRGIGLVITADTAREAIENLEQSHRYSFEWLHNQARTIENLAQKELRHRLFLYVPSERTKFWPTQEKPNAFGNEVSNAFPSASYDILNAGICFATSTTTACVFHLMRVLEIGLTALGARFGVSLAHTNWAPAIDQVESKIRNMHRESPWKELPDCKEQQEFYAQAASQFAIFKDAWRNHAMHVRGKYTEDEAERIFVSVQTFMQKLSTRLAEVTP